MGKNPQQGGQLRTSCMYRSKAEENQGLQDKNISSTFCSREARGKPEGSRMSREDGTLDLSEKSTADFRPVPITALPLSISFSFTIHETEMNSEAADEGEGEDEGQEEKKEKMKAKKRRRRTKKNKTLSPPTNMMIGETRRTYPTVEIPTWPASEDFTPAMNSPDCSVLEALAALQRYLPSNEPDPDSDPDLSGPDSPVDAYSCDHFRMYDFKVRRCARGRSHDWTECPYAHPGEKARRRDPTKYGYSGTACPDFRKGGCKKGDSCEFAHGVFECWLHPARYRTQPCKDGGNCRRRVCFFAHSPDQLRFIHNNRSPDRVDSFDVSSPIRRAFQLSVSPVSGSPPMSPRADSENHSLGCSSVNDVVASFRNLQLEKVKSFPSSYNNPLRCYQSGFGSPRGSILGHGFQSLPTTPIRPGNMDIWENGLEEEPAMERVVESGRELRAKMFEKLSKENCMDRTELDPDHNSGEAPDVGWVTELVM